MDFSLPGLEKEEVNLSRHKFPESSRKSLSYLQVQRCQLVVLWGRGQKSTPAFFLVCLGQGLMTRVSHIFLRWGLSFALELIKWLDGWPTGPGDPSVSSFPLLGLQVFATRPRCFIWVLETELSSLRLVQMLFTGEATSVAPPTRFRWDHRNAWHSCHFQGGVIHFTNI